MVISPCLLYERLSPHLYLFLFFFASAAAFCHCCCFYSFFLLLLLLLLLLMLLLDIFRRFCGLWFVVLFCGTVLLLVLILAFCDLVGGVDTNVFAL